MAMIREIPRNRDPDDVEGFCTTCKVECWVPDTDTPTCPECGNALDPLSLPRVPKPAVPATPPQARILTLQGAEASRKPPEPVAAPVAPSSSQPAASRQPFVLPPLDEAIAWYADTVKADEALEAEELRLTERLRNVKRFRKALGLILGQIEPPGRPVLAASEPEPEPTPELEVPTPAVEIVPVLTPATAPVPAAPSTNGHAAAPAGSGTWAPRLGLDGCRNCGTNERKHSSGGRCVACDNYWRSHGKSAERPLS